MSTLGRDFTLGKRKLQENEGRWLKFVSGLVILVLGVFLLLKPDWLSYADREFGIFGEEYLRR
jgi:hypothetical protein